MRLALVLLIAAAASAQTIEVQPWGKTPEGEQVQLYTLTNAKHGEVRIATYGGTVVSVKVPDKSGKIADVVLGFDSLDGYLGEHPYFGALVGRYGNRIAKGRFTLDGEAYWLATNNGPNALHGGLRGFNRRVWAAKPFTAMDGVGLALTYVSEDGEEGYPGTLTARVRYTWTADNTLRIEYAANTDAPTVKNLTNHSYFNLKDAGKSDALGHEVQIFGDHYTPVDATLIPSGEIAPVEGTPFDFRQSTAIGKRINEKDQQLRYGGGYDHNHVLSRRTKDGLELAVRVHEPATGRTMEVWTTEPGVQFYSGNFLDGTVTGKGGTKYQKRAAFCLETQHFPDSPNQKAFPTTVLRPGETYRSQTEYRFR
ncbi:MAG: galactose mutarotase [Bryobacterales bacterium]|nr:galactose mutarotase [Bryobacterales bacterium]